MPTSCVRQSRYPRNESGGATINERMLACALYKLFACALRPVAVLKGNSDGLLRLPDRQARLCNHAKAVTQRMQPFDSRVRGIHQA